MRHAVRIVHAADFHLGSPFSSLPFAKAQLRRREQRETFARMIAYCRENRTEILLLAGDVVDQARIPKEDMRAVIESLASIPDTAVFISPGNHDPDTEDSVYKNYTFPANVHVFGREFTYVYLPELRTAVWGAAFTSARTTRTLCPENFHVGNAGCPEDTIHMVLMHGEVTDGTDRSSYNPIRKPWIGASGADYLALGHLHNRTEPERIGGTVYAYSGCPESRGFDEPGQRGFYAGQISHGDVRLQPITVNLRTYDWRSVDISGCETTEQMEERIRGDLAAAYGESYSENAYRITLRGQVPPDLCISTEVLRVRLEPEVFALQLRDGTHVAEDFERLRRENTLRGRFVAMLLDRLEQSRVEQDTETQQRLRLALDIGLRAFEGEVRFDADH